LPHCDSTPAPALNPRPSNGGSCCSGRRVARVDCAPASSPPCPPQLMRSLCGRTHTLACVYLTPLLSPVHAKGLRHAFGYFIFRRLWGRNTWKISKAWYAPLSAQSCSEAKSPIPNHVSDIFMACPSLLRSATDPDVGQMDGEPQTGRGRRESRAGESAPCRGERCRVTAHARPLDHIRRDDTAHHIHTLTHTHQPEDWT